MAEAPAPSTNHNASRRAELHEKLTGTPNFLPKDFSPNHAMGEVKVQLVASSLLPTRFGEFRIVGFYNNRDSKEHTAIVHGEVTNGTGIPVRVHSECHTGDVWSSLRCDCRQQLEASIEYIAGRDRGAVVYLRQEGRGIGLLNKLKAYHLQDLGLDTIEANHYLGYPAEAREYAVAAQILALLEIRSIALLSNNPDKIEKLENEGVKITERIPVVVPSNDYNAKYLRTKKQRMGHLL